MSALREGTPPRAQGMNFTAAGPALSFRWPPAMKSGSVGQDPASHALSCHFGNGDLGVSRQMYTFHFVLLLSRGGYLGAWVSK